MHEMALTASLISLIKEEMEKAKAQRLLSVRIKYGALSNVVPEAMETAFEIQTMHDPALQEARLELLEELPRLACNRCKTEFEVESRRGVFMPCPVCGNEQGNRVLTGKGLYLEQIEVDGD
ncbi:MAG: hydrogenase maturation nickel metallochaperone HypA [Desulfovibrionaceae bacterium]|nr:hydrogenase maturation nickel metallochaperone HypA [Desulfovibrionaceae bacterium]